MNCSPAPFDAGPRLRSVLAALAVILSVTLAAGQTATGRISGLVTNRDATAFLEGATVTIDGSAQAAITDRRGEFDFTGLAPGEYRLRLSYTGMTTGTARAVVEPGQTAAVTVALREDVVKMGTFSVTADRNADALALTAQRNAANVKNVVDVQSYGMLNNDNPVELLQLLPGVVGILAFNEVDRVSVRGIDSSLNTVELDGNSFATPGINSASTERSSILSTTNTNNIKTAEVIKALTPDRSAAAIGGMVNLIQRTALDYPKSAGRFEYRLGSQYVETRSGFATRPTSNAQLTYHDVFGPRRNWGVYITGGYNKETTNQYSTNQTLANAAGFGLIPTGNTTSENYRLRFRRNWAATVDHRWGGAHEIAFKFKHDDWFESTESLNLNVSGAVPAPDWSPDNRNYLRPGGIGVQVHKNPPGVDTDSFSFEGKHHLGGWIVNYTAAYSRAITDVNLENSTEFVRVNSTLRSALLPQVPLFIDTSSSRLFPTLRLSAAAAAIVYNPDNYQIGNVSGAGGVTQHRIYVDDERKGGRIDVKRTFSWKQPVTFKTGFNVADQGRLQYRREANWAFAGEDGVVGSADDRISRFIQPNPGITGYNASGNLRPFVFDIGAVRRHIDTNPNLWVADAAGNATRSVANNFAVAERITAGYLMGDTKWRDFKVLGGVRWEGTRVTGTGLLRDTPTASAAQIPDPVARAINNSGRPVTRTSTYDNYFPSFHVVYRPRENLQARASYSTGIGRPGYGAVIPTTTINDTNRTINSNNTALEPQHADSYDLSLEYFTDPAGILSVGAFRKDIENYIVSQTTTVGPDFFLGEQYEGYDLTTRTNGGAAKVQGLEFNLVRQLNFIPRQLGLFTFKGNLTFVDATGDFGRASNVRGNEVPNFVPRAWNVVLEYAQHKFRALARFNHQDSFLFSPNANPLQARRHPARQKLDINVTYRWQKWCEVFFAIDNVAEKPAYHVIGPDGNNGYIGQVWDGQRRFNLSLSGKF